MKIIGISILQGKSTLEEMSEGHKESGPGDQDWQGWVGERPAFAAKQLHDGRSI
jgi:hypothetical protein